LDRVNKDGQVSNGVFVDENAIIYSAV